MTYYGLSPSTRRRLQIALAIPILVVFLGLVFGLLTGNRILLVAAGLLTMLAMPVCIWLVRQLRQTRLGVGKEGLRLRGVLGREEVELLWDAIERLHVDSRHQVIVLREPFDHPVTKSMARAGQVRFSDAPPDAMMQSDLVAQQRWIPFESFAGWFERGKLLDEIRRYAPRLAEDYDRVAPEFSAVLKRRRKYLTIGCILAAVVVVALLGLTIAILASVPAGKTISFGTLMLILAQATWSIVILLLVPMLGYFACTNFLSAFRDWKQQDKGAAFASLAMAAVQAGFAVWIASAILFGKRE